MLVYVKDINGQPLMPTDRCGKIRKLIKAKKAKIINRCPFTIQLLYETKTYITQPVRLKVDSGSHEVGVSASTEKKVLYESEVTLRNDISDLITARREFRRARRNRKTRYRKPRFKNRKKPEGWLPPSTRHKVDTHLDIIAHVCRLLPVTSMTIEVASFDTQLLKAQLDGKPLPEGKDYQNGELADWNVREYVFHRDGYKCQWCKGKSKDKVLHTHHWNYWRGDHTNKPSSMITLCSTCNDSKNHKPEAKKLWGWEPMITHNFKDAAFMNTMRWKVYGRLKETYPDLDINLTYGYITKNTRIKAGLPKTHHIDARCAGGNVPEVSDGTVYYQKKVRCHNRQLHKATFLKGHVRKSNQAAYMIKGFRLYDKVLFEGQECFIFGRRTAGYFDLRLLDGTKIHQSASWKKLRLLEPAKTYLTERRTQDNDKPQV